MRRLWNYFISLKTAIVLITILSLLSVIGTLIPQGRDAREYLAIYPRAGNWILALGFDDMYRGSLFQIALILVSISALACTKTRIQLTRRRFSRRLATATPQEVLSFPLTKRLTPGANVALGRFDTPPRSVEDGSTMHLRVSGRLALLGSPLLHIGFLLILIGGLVSHFIGIEISITGVEGQKVPIAPIEAVQAGTKADQIRRQARNIESANPSDPRLNVMRQRIEELEGAYHLGLSNPIFHLEFVKLWVDYYAGKTPEEMNSMVKGWNSQVNVIVGSETIPGPILRVNEPFSYGGYTFYQADWGQKFGKVDLLVLPNPAASQPAKLGSAPVILTLRVREPVQPPWSSHTIVLLDFMPDFRMVNGQFVSVSEQLNNPAAQIGVYNADESLAGGGWAFPPEMSGMSRFADLPYTFQIFRVEPVFESGLQVCHDPGTPIVWLGCWVMMIGMAMTFYLPYFEDWVIRRPNGRIVLAVHGNRPVATLRQRLEALELETTGVAPQEAPTDGSSEKGTS